MFDLRDSLLWNGIPSLKPLKKKHIDKSGKERRIVFDAEENKDSEQLLILHKLQDVGSLESMNFSLDVVLNQDAQFENVHVWKSITPFVGSNSNDVKFAACAVVDLPKIPYGTLSLVENVSPQIWETLSTRLSSEFPMLFHLEKKSEKLCSSGICYWFPKKLFKQRLDGWCVNSSFGDGFGLKCFANGELCLERKWGNVSLQDSCFFDLERFPGISRGIADGCEVKFVLDREIAFDGGCSLAVTLLGNTREDLFLPLLKPEAEVNVEDEVQLVLLSPDLEVHVGFRSASGEVLRLPCESRKILEWNLFQGKVSSQVVSFKRVEFGLIFPQAINQPTTIRIGGVYIGTHPESLEIAHKVVCQWTDTSGEIVFQKIAWQESSNLDVYDVWNGNTWLGRTSFTSFLVKRGSSEEKSQEGGTSRVKVTRKSFPVP
eukprot:TRINITY_DN40896_c0_g1_i1.p1 TRINITY_DN40896_c0_g1~~TRINITY_DN40896_c0_g1_i1.p1  ORF type:complete len:431 (+),score=94.73 TRINITY_DN40896_c0_g1_i1:1436-2728(+)